MTDQIDAAIAAVDKPRGLKMARYDLTITSTGRPFKVAFPMDMTDAEVHEVCAWLLMAFPKVLADLQGRTPSGIVLPRPPGQ